MRYKLGHESLYQSVWHYWLAKDKGPRASRNCFWNRYWGRAVSYWPILSLPRLTVPEVLEEVTRPRFPLVSTVANLNFNIFYQQHQLFCLLLTFKKLQTTFRVSMWPKTYKACLALVRATFIRCLSLTNLNKQIEKEHKDDARFHRKAHSMLFQLSLSENKDQN